MTVVGTSMFLEKCQNVHCVGGGRGEGTFPMQPEASDVQVL